MRVDRSIIARRATPSCGRMDGAFNTIARAAERRLAAESDLGGDLPEQFYLNHSPLAEDPRGGASRASLTDTFRGLGLRSFTRGRPLHGPIVG